MVPQIPVANICEPEVTFFTIINVANNGGNSNMVWRMRGNDANSDILIRLFGVGNAFLELFVRSSNGQTLLATDTVSVVADGNSYLVVIQYSFLTKTGRIIINGRVNSATNLLQNTFDFVADPTSGFALNQNAAGGAVFLGNTGELVFYDGA